MASSKNVPITLVSGFEGAGKTTLIESVVRSLGSRRIVVLADDGEKDLFEEIEEAVGVSAADAIIIECTANLEPFFVAEHLVQGDEEMPPPAGIRVDTLVTVVDAANFIRDFRGDQELLERGLAFEEGDDRMVSELLAEQVEFADVLVINKADKAGVEALDQLEAFLRRLNPRAKIVRATAGEVPARAVFETGLFDFFETDDGAGWLSELSGDFADVGSEHGVTSFSYTERRPFHPIRLNELLNEFETSGLVRAKGYVWVATRHHEIGIWSLAGQASLITYGGAWFAATPARDWPKDPRDRAEIMQEWVPPFGDRRQEIAFIGANLDEAEIVDRLNECLLTHAEMKDGPDSWYAIPDPLPDWHADTDSESYS